MKTLFPAYIGLSFMLLILQTYLLFYITILALQRIKLLKKPYAGMDYSESLLAGIILLGVLLLSSADTVGLFQAAKTYEDIQGFIEKPTLLFFARSFMIILSISALFVVLNFLNIRLFFRDYFQAPSLPVSILLSAIAVALALVGWLTCKEIVDNMTPKLINFQ